MQFSVYTAPQILEGKSFTYKCDIWSLGITFYEALYGNLPWVGENANQLLEKIKTQVYWKIFKATLISTKACLFWKCQKINFKDVVYRGRRENILGDPFWRSNFFNSWKPYLKWLQTISKDW